MKISESTLIALALAIGVGITSCQKGKVKTNNSTEQAAKETKPVCPPDPIDCPACGMG